MVMVLLNLNVLLSGGGGSKFWDVINKLLIIDENWYFCMIGVI